MILQGLQSCFTVPNLLVALLGTGAGIVIGALPGLGATIALTLALPLGFKWSPDTALILLMALYCGATYGGSVSAILLNTPGTPASGASTFDGYPLAQKGKADIALGLSTMSSFIGGIIGAIILLTVAPLITKLVLAFGPSQFFLVAIFSLCIISAMKEGQLLKGLLICGFGMMLSFVGRDVLTGTARFSFGYWYFAEKFNYTSVMIGCFALSEMLLLMERGGDMVSKLTDPGKIRNVIKGCREALRYPLNLARSALIGSTIGAMPALGVTTASFLSYMLQVNSSKDPESYGQGNYQGVIAPETANNAVTATALIPTLALGIPGSGTMAVVLGALTMKGLVPGPDLFTVSGKYVYTIMFSFFIINFMMMIIGVLGSGSISRITLLSNRLLVPCVVVFCIVGSFALKTFWQDMLLAVVMGFVGYFMKKNNYPTVGLVLGLVLGPIAERSFHQALRISNGNYAIFYESNINKLLLALIFLAIFVPLVKRIIKQMKAAKANIADPA